jgi:triacylglycerol esterase/lipase EstA (alpha/beta hydrolase family)
VAERYADGLATDSDINAAAEAAQAVHDEIEARDPNSVESGAAHAAHLSIQAPSDVSHPVAWVMTHAHGYSDYVETLSTNLAFLADLFRDVFGNPYRPRRLQAAWLTPRAVHLAQLIYERQTFSRMSELASVLENAGCHDQEILDHCGKKRIHVKGCWVLDLLLGKDPQE